ncbi:hypothetical protein GGR50DRAFT_690176 [Xylaria sp. CBS 124048]|nr:hypothetical protein GGR50DRAFT_690176 [Xylaria sp. CBS 124048]
MSNGWKDTVKSGWQYGKEGSSSLRNQVKGLVNRGDNAPKRDNHIAAPRSSLRDPSSFGPPPKHIAARAPVAPRPASSQATATATASATAPVKSTVEVSYHAQQTQHAVEQLAAPTPYRVDTTGLSTSHLPPPPARLPAHLPLPNSTAIAQAKTTAKSRIPPSLPPRLPPRTENNTQSPVSTIAQAANQGSLNQEAINNLGAAGISVPGLGIGGGKTPLPQPAPRTRPAPHLAGSPTQTSSYGQIDELQSRFARMGASSSHGSDGGIMDNAQGHPARSVLGKKKPPPPPIPKKPVASRRGENTDSPPPVPLATRPKFA